MRLASFNVENLFRRPKALNTVGWDDGPGRQVLAAYAELEALFQRTAYGTPEKERILTLLDTLGLLRSDESEWAFLRRARGQLVRRPEVGAVEVIADGRGDWIGWLELKREAVSEVATRNTARVVADLRADVLAVIEAEDRPALDRFNRDVLPLGFAANKKEPWDYRHVMLVDGNDDRGIDVGLLSRTSFPIERVRSHVADRDSSGKTIFSRDCAEYEIALPDEKPLLLLVNHFKSKGFGSQSSSNAKRRQQAARVAKIYKTRRQEGWERVAVAGDLNDTPTSPPLAALAQTDLKDISEHEKFKSDGRTGTYGTGKDKIDYLLLSPALFATVKAGGYHRAGVYRGPRVKNPWKMLDTITEPLHQASDHAAVWADLKV